MMVRVISPHNQTSEEVVAKSKEKFECKRGKMGISCGPRSTPARGAVSHPTHTLGKKG